MREIDKIIMAAREANASDIHITKGLYLLYRVKGTLVHAPMQPTPEETEEMLYGLLDEGQKKRLDEGYDIDFAIQTEDGNRQRVNVFRTQKRIAATIRLLNSYIPTLEELEPSGPGSINLPRSPGADPCDRANRQWKVYDPCLHD